MASKQTVNKTPTLKDYGFQYKLISEKFNELFQSIIETDSQKTDLVRVANTLSNILYATYGAGHTFGIDLDAYFAEIHRRNMKKFTNIDKKEDTVWDTTPSEYTPDYDIDGNRDSD